MLECMDTRRLGKQVDRLVVYIGVKASASLCLSVCLSVDGGRYEYPPKQD